LDMRAKDVLLEALRAYSGTVVFVSHDRYFIDQLATRVIEIEEGHVHVYPGNYEDYLWRKQGGPDILLAPPAGAAVSEARREPEAAPSRDGDGAVKRANPMKLKKLREQLKEVEQEVAALETEIARHEAALAEFKSADETVRLTLLVDERRKDLDARVAEWEQLSAQIEATTGAPA